MASLVLFRSKHGTTKKIANMIFNELTDENKQLIDLKKSKEIELNIFDNIIIGGSIHAGTLQPDLSKFIEKNKPDLLEKSLALYLCCMEDEPKASEELNSVFSEELRTHAYVCEILGGEFLFEEMNFVERLLVKKIAGVSSSVSKLKDQDIASFIEKINATLKA